MLSCRHLPNTQPDEQIILFLRRHPFVFFSQILSFIFLLLLPFIAVTLMINIKPEIFENFFARPILFPFSATLTAIYFLYIWLFLFYGFADYYLDVWIVTNIRIINIEQKGFFNRVVSEQKLFRIQDVTSEIIGIIPTFLNYGTVYIQTAGTEQRFIFKEIPYPYKVREKIIHLVEKYKRVHSTPNEER